MKRGTTPRLRLGHTLELSGVERIDFLFKQAQSEAAPALLKKTWLPAGGQVEEEKGVFEIPFTVEESRLFAEGKPFYCDPRITLTGGSIPATGILQFSCRQTLWGEQDD